MSGAQPTLVLAFTQKETRVYIGTGKLAVFQASSLHLTIVHHTVIVARGSVQQCSAQLHLPESKQHLCPVSAAMEYPAHEDNLLLSVEVSVMGLVGVLESSAQLSIQQTQLVVLTLKSTLFLKSSSHLLWSALTLDEDRAVFYPTDVDFFKVL